MKTQVVNLRTHEYTVYIGRAGHGKDGYFGNPFSIGQHGTREEVIERYREYFEDRITHDPEFKARVEALRGQILGCFCKPQACHGDIIAKYLED